jgi:oxygen-independent coproporphyrinogen-3 oxidase
MTTKAPILEKYAAHLATAEERVRQLHQFQELGMICKQGDFYPAVHYPPITKYPPTTAEELFSTYTLPADKRFDIYVHFPFCMGQCVFCHYPVKLGDRPEEKDRYLDYLEREMDIYMSFLGVDKLKSRSILIGGGTPTYMSPQQLERFLKYFTKRVDLSTCTQFNYDVDPNTMVGPEGSERLKIMKDYGVDRITIGVQSFNETILKGMNRMHGVGMALDSIEQCLRFDMITNIEFIFGFPGQTLENWAEVVEQAVGTGVHEIQLYRLKVETYGDRIGTIKRKAEEQAEDFITPEDTLRMKALAHGILRDNGYHETIGRVFAKDPKNYSHYADNQCCKLRDQIGLGLTAFSSLRDRFGLNTKYFKEYHEAIDAGKLPLNRGFIRDLEEQARWSTLLPIKNREILKGLFKMNTGLQLYDVFGDRLRLLEKWGLVVNEDKKVVPTMTGRFFADEIALQFYSPTFQPFPREDYSDGELNPYTTPVNLPKAAKP